MIRRRLLPVILAVMAATAPAFAAPVAPDGVLGIPWGSSKEKVKEVMSARADVIFDHEEAGRLLWFKGGDFAGRRMMFFVGATKDDKIYQGDVVLVQQYGSQQAQFEEIKKMLIAKYGPPNSEGHHEGEIKAAWSFRVANQKDPTQITLFSNERRWKIGWGVTVRYSMGLADAPPPSAPSKDL